MTSNEKVELKLEIMREKAAELVAMRLRDVLVKTYSTLSTSGWSDEDIRTIQDQALDSCKTTG